MVGIAVAAMVPGDDAPAGFGEERCENIEGASEIGAAVDEEKRRGIERAPLANGDTDAEGTDPAMAVGAVRAGEVEKDLWGIWSEGHRRRLGGIYRTYEGRASR